MVAVMAQIINEKLIASVKGSIKEENRQSLMKLIDDMRRLGPVNFVPTPPGYRQGPPPGGCPYACEDGDKGGTGGEKKRAQES